MPGISGYQGISPAQGVSFAQGVSLYQGTAEDFNSPAFSAQLKTSIVPEIGGAPTFTRATTATIFDHENILRTAKISESRFWGVRRVENLLPSSEMLSGNAAGSTIDVNVALSPEGTLTADRLNKGTMVDSSDWVTNTVLVGISIADRKFRYTIYVKGEGANVGKKIRVNTKRNGGTLASVETTITLTGDWQRVTSPVLTGLSDNTGVRFVIGHHSAPEADSVLVWGRQGEEVTGQTNQNPAEYVSTGVLSFPYHGAGVDGVKYFDYENGNTVDANGVVTEAVGVPITGQMGYFYEAYSAIYVGLYSDDLTNAAWVKTNITATKDQTGANGRANSATRLTATAANGTVLQSYTRASTNRFTHAWIKRITGSGAVEMTQDNGATWTPVTVTSSWARVGIDNVTSANPSFGLRVTTSGDEVAVQWLQNVETSSLAGGYASPVTTTSTGAVSRNADVLTYPNPRPGNTQQEGTIAASFGLASTSADSVPVTYVISSSQDLRLWHWGGSATHIQGEREASGAREPVSLSVTWTPFVRKRIAMSWSTQPRNAISVDGGTVVANTAITLPWDDISSSPLSVGAEGVGITADVKQWRQPLSDASLQSETAP